MSRLSGIMFIDTLRLLELRRCILVNKEGERWMLYLKEEVCVNMPPGT